MNKTLFALGIAGFAIIWVFYNGCRMHKLKDEDFIAGDLITLTVLNWTFTAIIIVILVTIHYLT